MRLKFDEQLALLNEELITMGALCENAIATSSKALTSGDFELAAGVRVLSEQINQKEKDIQNLCLKLLLQQQPVAKDLRAISSALKMITDMERIGDRVRRYRRDNNHGSHIRFRRHIQYKRYGPGCYQDGHRKHRRFRQERYRYSKIRYRIRRRGRRIF